MSRLESLPSELIVAILIDLDFRDLLHCREVCTTFKRLVDDDVRAECKLELAVSGMQDDLSSPLTPVERLSILRARQKAWNEFTWTAQENVPMHGGAAWELTGNVLVQSDGARTLHFKQIPSAVRGIEGIEWTIPDVGCGMAGFGMDPTQDLLVIIEHFWNENSKFMCRLHLKALSTGAPHPAGPPEGMLIPQSTRRPSSHFIETSENHLGFLIVYGGSKELVVWDWKLGTLQLHLTGSEIGSWAFLTSRLILIAKMHSRYNEETRRMVYIPHLVVIDLESHASSACESPEPVALSDANVAGTFHFPPLTDHIAVLDMIIRSNPKPTHNEPPTPLPPSTVPPFSLSGDPEHRLFLVSLRTMSSTTRAVVLHALIPASTFLRALSRSKHNPQVVPAIGSSETQAEHDVAWAEWGKHGARLFATSGHRTATSSEVCYVHGTAFVTTQVDSDPDPEAALDDSVRTRVIVRDFNQLALRRHAHAADRGSKSGGKYSSGIEEQSVRVVTEATVWEPAGMFKEEVTTSLPYTERVLVLSQPSEEGQDDPSWDEVIPTEDAFVLVTSTSDSRFRCRIMSI